MHFTLLIYGSLDTLSGGYLYDRQLVAQLRAAGHTVEILSRPWRNYAAHLRDNFDPAWRAQLRAARGEVMIQDELNHPSLFWVNRTRAKTRPVISLVHHLRSDEQHPPLLKGLYHQIERAYLRTVDGFIFNSHTTQRAVAQHLAAPLPPHVVAWPAGNRWDALPTLAEIDARAAQPRPLQIVFVGNVVPRKGLHTLLAGLSQLPLHQWHLTIVGRPDVDAAYWQALQRQIAQLGLAHRPPKRGVGWASAHILPPPLGQLRDPFAANLTWRGAVNDAALQACLANSDVLAVPSSYEGFGIVYLEGMAFGLPALATTAGAAAEIITPTVNGWLIPPNDAHALAAALRPLLTNRASLREMAHAARQRFAQHPTWEQSMTRARVFLETLT